jgi:hypothetical protein
MPRASFLARLAAAACLPGAVLARREAAAAADTNGRRRLFERWLLDYQLTPNDLCRYYRFGPHANQESPLATAYAILLLNESHPDVADRLVAGLGRLQHAYASNRYVSGGVPSVANDSAPLFYSSDALAATKAIMEVYKLRPDPTRLRIASGFVEFVKRMVDGERVGMLVDNLDFPMQYVTPNGQYQNLLVPNVAMLFWDALRDFTQASGDASAAKLFDLGQAFLLRAQAANGAYYDHYDPGYPPKGYSSQRWRWYKIEQDGRKIGIGDNMMMSALGAQRMGQKSAADAFLRWAKPKDGAFYAYIDVDTGGSGFRAGSEPYYDVVCSGMYYNLLVTAGRLDSETRRSLERVFTLVAAPDGGYRWGIQVNGGAVQDSAEALVTGYWIALASGVNRS